ncbi:hypothetical protein P872_21945 [Rhodonellum psychrophilum GCM71 = DSM 17998]|uniref:Major facilitator superfamily (MFS) profile domain-containing protein n=2 Tax=Rhodonellum TaxID=336827 RepID=U5BWX3_9BACT|nr:MULTISPECIES: MFS transporter [Rhodonellum]ERM80407.1 hypothetical protein P872_21945 [Rhodonellum psychrophilum GCM71 = DSM 17998]MDO9552415.1 MFS transporter [Rhodonellum sp.]SDY51094.1 MFS transporter, CP family, cyanate transporter [Rhodonellum ikkaensis]
MKKINFLSSPWFLFLGILLLSFNLRPSITAVGPLIPMIRDELGLSNAWAGFLTTLPLLTFATFSLFSAAIGKRLGIARAIFFALLILLLGTIIRIMGGTWLLFFGTGLTGIGIVICNVLLIPFIKNRLPDKIGIATGAFTSGMILFAAIASGISAPMALDFGWGWKGSLFSWTGLIILGILFWIPQIRNHKVKVQLIQEDKAINVWKSRLAWQISTFMGVQSLMFFTLIAWLPDMLISRGLSEVEAGLVLSLMQIIGLSASFLAPIVGVKFKDQVPLAWSLGGLYFVGFSSLFSQTLLVNYIGLSLVGIATGASLSFAYMIIGLRTQSEKTTASLSGMAQSTGYYLAALGPLLFGLAFDMFGNWDLLIYLMLFCTLLFVFFGVKSGRARVIGFEVLSKKN